MTISGGFKANLEEHLINKYWMGKLMISKYVLKEVLLIQKSVNAYLSTLFRLSQNSQPDITTLTLKGMEIMKTVLT